MPKPTWKRHKIILDVDVMTVDEDGESMDGDTEQMAVDMTHKALIHSVDAFDRCLAYDVADDSDLLLGNYRMSYPRVEEVK